MTATTAVTLPLGPLDPERSELLRRVVDGLEPASLHWLSGFTAGVAYARGQGGVAAVASTHRDGDPPGDALGDSSCPKFCETSRQVNGRLAALGARRLLPRVDCDLDFERLVTPWLEQAVAGARDALGTAPAANVTRLRSVPATPRYSREQPFLATSLANDRITGRGASKNVRHIELSLEGSGLEYEPGDASEIWHENPGVVVDAVLAAIGAPGTEPVTVDGEQRRLRAWLAQGREITRLTKPFLVQHAQRARSAELAEILKAGNEELLRSTAEKLQLVDVLQRYPATWEPETLVQALRPLVPRLYSIASSRAAVGEVTALAGGLHWFGDAPRLWETLRKVA